MRLRPELFIIQPKEQRPLDCAQGDLIISNIHNLDYFQNI